ncbi:hypothetical protein L1987_64545 [Smallanthus sonchifolius]|uniref:Uncharacterized protein n=1 Tax=Smallanthus sonchifolius TaxID=185202 RepID=A0ACB9BS26_9ASTR|nr:hypothetical protein L1987_64545 [Smallanthus sonchifolius]
MLCLLEGHDMLGFINESPPAENTSVLGKERVGLWRRSDALVKGWILGSLSQQTLVNLVKTNTDFTAKDVWEKLQTIYGPTPLLQQARGEEEEEEEEEVIPKEISISEDAKSKDQEEAEEKENSTKETEERTKLHQSLYEATRSQHYNKCSTKRPDILMKLLKTVPEESTLPGIQNSEGSTVLHAAANVDNTDAAEMLVKENKELLFVKDKDGQTPLAIALSKMHTKTYLCLLNDTPETEKANIFQSTSGVELLVNAISSKE